MNDQCDEENHGDTAPVDAVVIRLLCKDCQCDIGAARSGKSGRQQVRCEACKRERLRAGRKKRAKAWNFVLKEKHPDFPMP
jgi:hypothetical protein